MLIGKILRPLNNGPSNLFRRMMESSFAKPNLNQIRQEFVKYEGGQVTLSKLEADGLAFICIDHPDKKNGFSGKMMVDLNEAVCSLENWENGKGVILYGKGDMFCSGGYLKTVREIATASGGYQMCSLMQDSLRRLRQLPLVSLSIIHGKALGGGAELILGTDFRLMSSTAQIAYVEARMGVGTGWGGGTLLTELVGRSTALDLLLTCRQLSSLDALRIGLVNDLIPPESDLDEESRLDYGINWLKERTQAHDPTVVHTMKRIVNCQDLEMEKEIFAPSWGGPQQLNALSLNVKHK